MGRQSRQRHVHAADACCEALNPDSVCMVGSCSISYLNWPSAILGRLAGKHKWKSVVLWHVPPWWLVSRVFPIEHVLQRVQTMALRATGHDARGTLEVALLEDQLGMASPAVLRARDRAAAVAACSF